MMYRGSTTMFFAIGFLFWIFNFVSWGRKGVVDDVLLHDLKET